MRFFTEVIDAQRFNTYSLNQSSVIGVFCPHSAASVAASTSALSDSAPSYLQCSAVHVGTVLGKHDVPA